MPSWDAVGLQAPSHLAALAVACGVVVALIFRVRLAAALSNVRKMYCDAGWEAYVDDEGRTYYYNELSGVTTWERPGCVPVVCRQLAMVAAWVARLAMAAVAWTVEIFTRCAGAPLRKAWDATYAHRFQKLHEEPDAEVAADATVDAPDVEANAVNNEDQGDDPDAAGAPEGQEEVDETPAEPVKKSKYEKPSGPPKQTKRGSVIALGVGQRSKVRGAASMFESGAIAERQEKEREEREKEARRMSLKSTSVATAESPAGAPAASEDGAAKEKEEEKTEPKESGEDAGDVKEGADANEEGAPASEAIADAPAAAPAASDE